MKCLNLRYHRNENRFEKLLILSIPSCSGRLANTSFKTLRSRTMCPGGQWHCSLAYLEGNPDELLEKSKTERWSAPACLNSYTASIKWSASSSDLKSNEIHNAKKIHASRNTWACVLENSKTATSSLRSTHELSTLCGEGKLPAR